MVAVVASARCPGSFPSLVVTKLQPLGDSMAENRCPRPSALLDAVGRNPPGALVLVVAINTGGYNQVFYAYQVVFVVIYTRKN